MRIIVTAVYACPKCNCRITCYDTDRKKYCLRCGKRMELVSASCRPVKKDEGKNAAGALFAAAFL